MKPCKSFPGYSATDDGRIISHKLPSYPRRVDENRAHEMSQRKDKKGYMRVGIILDGNKRKCAFVHRLVADAFHGPCPEGMQVRHLNSDRGDNRPCNLAYGTAKDNAMDRMEIGRYANGEDVTGAKLTNEQANEVRRLRAAGEKIKSLSKMFGLSDTNIKRIIYNKSYFGKATNRTGD